MLKRILIGVVFVLVQYSIFAQTDNLINTNVLMLYDKNFNQDTKYVILNQDKSVFAKIESKNGNEPSCDLLENEILAYYPDFYMFHFYLVNIDELDCYCVRIGNEEKYIMKDSTMKIRPINEYLKLYYCKATKVNPLREKPNAFARIMPVNYNDCYFKVLKFKGNWIKVESIIDEENKHSYVGWIMWKNKDKIVLDYPYTW